MRTQLGPLLEMTKSSHQSTLIWAAQKKEAIEIEFKNVKTR
jgi:hypothetical protein